jgi:hypothetical protein
MAAPLCICNGLIRSGSTWSFNVCRELSKLLARQTDELVKSGYLEPVQLEHFVTKKWPAMTAPSVIKVHDIGPAALAALRSGSASAVCTFRDPRDCVASDMVFMGFPFEVSVKRIGGTLELLRLYQSTASILLVKYEDMMMDRPREINRIAAHLGVRVDESLVRQIDAMTNIESSKRLCAGLGDRPADQVRKVANHLVDPVTHLHQNHINGGTIGRWKSEFSIDQLRFMTEYFEPWLLKMGYEDSGSINAFLRNSGLPAQSPGYAPACWQIPPKPADLNLSA